MGLSPLYPTVASCFCVSKSLDLSFPRICSRLAPLFLAGSVVGQLRARYSLRLLGSPKVDFFAVKRLSSSNFHRRPAWLVCGPRSNTPDLRINAESQAVQAPAANARPASTARPARSTSTSARPPPASTAGPAPTPSLRLSAIAHRDSTARPVRSTSTSARPTSTIANGVEIRDDDGQRSSSPVSTRYL